MKKLLKAAIIQHAPVFLNLEQSTDRALEFIDEAADHHAELIVFPETWLPGYPVWLDFSPEAGLWDHPPANTLYRLLAENSIQIEDACFRRLSQKASERSVTIVMGTHERKGRSLYNTMFYFFPDGNYDLHRKLMPTYTERLIWAQGDGSTLPVTETDEYRLGGLICWEHWMPLARAAMHEQNEHVHIAQWPMVKELHQTASRHYAFEGQCFVLAAGAVLSKQQMLDGIHTILQNNEDEIALELIDTIPSEPNDWVLKGGSAFIRPDGTYLVQPVYDKSQIIYAEMNLSLLTEGNLLMDTSGHYSRPDIFKLSVDISPKQNVVYKPGIDED